MQVIMTGYISFLPPYAGEERKTFWMSWQMGSGRGTSVRAMVFCLGWPSCYPGTVLGFFQFRIAINLFLMGARRVIERCALFLLLSSLLIIYHCKIYQW